VGAFFWGGDISALMAPLEGGETGETGDLDPPLIRRARATVDAFAVPGSSSDSCLKSSTFDA
jgi:hypothetical protein